jgi:DNA-binding XRE family transcriptional regulator
MSAFPFTMPIHCFDFINAKIISQKALSFVKVDYLLAFLTQNRNFLIHMRKTRKLTLAQLSQIIRKSQSTISKYETGEIVVDIETLYDIADALHIHAEQLLCCRRNRASISSSGYHPAVTVLFLPV